MTSAPVKTIFSETGTCMLQDTHCIRHCYQSCMYINSFLMLSTIYKVNTATVSFKGWGSQDPEELISDRTRIKTQAIWPQCLQTMNDFNLRLYEDCPNMLLEMTRLYSAWRQDFFTAFIFQQQLTYKVLLYCLRMLTFLTYVSNHGPLYQRSLLQDWKTILFSH